MSSIVERRGLPVSGYLIPIGKQYNFFFLRFSSGETGANLIYTFLTSSKKFAPIQKVSPSQRCSHRNSVQNGPIERSTALMATIFVKKHKIDPDPKEMLSSQSFSHRNSVQNGPIERSTALMATLFVKMHKIDPDPKKSRHHKVVRTEILCRMVRLINSQLSGGPLS